MRHLTIAILPILALTAAGCDAATEMAGDALQDQVRTMAVEQCQQAAENLGISSENVQPVCECATDELLADGANVQEIDQQRMTEIVTNCAAAEEGVPQVEGDAPAAG